MCRLFVVLGNELALLGMPDIKQLDIHNTKCNTIEASQQIKQIKKQKGNATQTKIQILSNS